MSEVSDCVEDSDEDGRDLEDDPSGHQHQEEAERVLLSRPRSLSDAKL